MVGDFARKCHDLCNRILSLLAKSLEVRLNPVLQSASFQLIMRRSRKRMEASAGSKSDMTLNKASLVAFFAYST